jgi:polyhydroxybutyrate depolymerase
MIKFLKILSKILLGIFGLFICLLLALLIVFKVVDRNSGTIITSGETRRYLLYVPDSYDPKTPTPLVIAIHGFAEWPAHEARISHWNTLADEYGFIVVYPSGTKFPKRWRTYLGTEASGDPAIDVKFISDLIDKLETEYNIDPARIFANGLSNGGGMSTVLGCQLSNRIAAVGSVAGAYVYSLEACNPSRPVPLIAFHGTADPVVPFQGGPSRSFDVPFPVVVDWVGGWAVKNKCVGNIVNLPAVGAVSGIRYTGCDQNAEVVFYTIQGGGHSWPGGDPLPKWIVGETNRDVDATRLLWEFFQQHPLAK